MNKPELIEAMAARSGLTQTDSEKALNAFIGVVTDTLVKKEKVQLVGFGSFETQERDARDARNPKTGETIKVPAKTIAKFYPGSKLKEAVEG